MAQTVELKNQVSSFDDEKFLCENLTFAGLENYKLLRVNLSFAIRESEKCPVIGITSTNRDEGKTTTAINLAYVLSEDNKKVLLIDGDLRLPSIAKKLKINATSGLTDLLSFDGNKALKVYKAGEKDNFFVLPSGELPPNPSELLGSDTMKKALDILCENFDIIIIDLPPAGIVSDALAVSKYLKGIVYVVRSEYVKKREIDKVIRQFQFAGAKILGFVMTSAKNKQHTYYKSKSDFKK